MRIANWPLVLGSAMAVTVACLALGAGVAERAPRSRLGGPSHTHPPVDAALEPLEHRLYGISPASLILYTPPGFRNPPPGFRPSSDSNR
jgi:hypothetical protein